MLVGMPESKVYAHEVSDGNEDAIGNYNKGCSFCILERICLHFVHGLGVCLSLCTGGGVYLVYLPEEISKQQQNSGCGTGTDVCFTHICSENKEKNQGGNILETCSLARKVWAKKSVVAEESGAIKKKSITLHQGKR